jgi:hypothetical protein
VANVELKFVKGYIDRHGRPRHYLRRRGCKLVPLPGLPGSPEFMAAYEAGLADTPRVEIGANRTRVGSINAAAVGYLTSAAFVNLADTTKIKYRRVIEQLRCAYGDMSVATLARKHVIKILDAKADDPNAARGLSLLAALGTVRASHWYLRQ